MLMTFSHIRLAIVVGFTTKVVFRLMLALREEKKRSNQEGWSQICNS